ncbi:hypothetical protein GCM10017688_64190 [Streptomyces ramulosus]
MAAHCDLRLDQFLVADDGTVHLTDLEEFRAECRLRHWDFSDGSRSRWGCGGVGGGSLEVGPGTWRLHYGEDAGPSWSVAERAS